MPSDELLDFIKTKMETFLLTHVPQIALQVLGEIERLTSIEQLQASLGAYQQMIRTTGAQGMQHFEQLTELLDEHVSRRPDHLFTITRNKS
jgi:hypothetical protein